MNALLAGLIALLGLIGLAAVVAPKVKIPAPVLLVIAGIVWALTPGLAPPEIDPHIILSVFLPPLLYSDAWRASWHDFRRWLRPILSLAIGLVAFTIGCVGVAAKWAMPDLPWAVCFMIGAMVSPTDTVAVHAVLGRLRLPRRFTAIVGGESLINDATGLLGVQLASIVVLTGVFEASAIGIEFVRISVVGILSGVVVGLLAVGINARLRGTSILFVFSLVAPYLAFGLAEAFGASGVLAVVIAGFVASWRIDLIPAESRIELTSDWDVLAFIFNGVMFLFVGLEIPHHHAVDPAAATGLLRFGLIVGATVVAARLVWFWPAAYIPLWFFPRLRVKEGGYPPPRAVLLASWCGVRGAVSLAAALALPLALPDGTPFPGRAAVEMAVLVTIVVTLIGQGSTIVPLLRLLRIPADATTEAETRKAREAMLTAGIERLDAFCNERSCPVAVFRYREVMADRLAVLKEEEESERTHAAQRLEVSRDVRRAVWKAASDALLRLRDAGEINDRDHQDLQLELDREYAELDATA